MSIIAAERLERIVVFSLDPSYASFVAKAQKAKTRKDKDYFILRVTIPKDVAEKIGAGPEDYLVLRAKKAQWFHMVNWTEMETTWNMLPSEVQKEVTLSGLPNPTLLKLPAAPSSPGVSWSQLAGATGTDMSVKLLTQSTQPESR